jgi:Raf kinase inhibitor-like YbhB/YbcL family protein
MFELHCSSYGNEGMIPLQYTHQTVKGGKNISPGFSWSDPPINTKSFVFSIVDPHPVAKNWVHWFLIDIPFRDRSIPEGASRTENLPRGSRELLNTYGEPGYGGPAPPPGSGSHPYVSTLYALSVEKLKLGKGASLREFLKELEGKVVAEASMTGYYERK